MHEELRGLLAPVFAQARSRLAAFAYLGALLAEPGDRRSFWQLAEAAEHRSPRRLQALRAEHAWDWKTALGALQRFILAHLADPQAHRQRMIKRPDRLPAIRPLTCTSLVAGAGFHLRPLGL